MRGNRGTGCLRIGECSFGWVTLQFEADDVEKTLPVESIRFEVEPHRLLGASARGRQSEKAERNSEDDASHRCEVCRNETSLQQELVRRRVNGPRPNERLPETSDHYEVGVLPASELTPQVHALLFGEPLRTHRRTTNPFAWLKGVTNCSGRRCCRKR